ncbi:unnamed protein product [Rotaria sp. Silwood1]|nr:unnamed protein product [Rotaria sp. Silwood1]CAF1646084.1 unnamed protein product [Rotaria sp. Silwood1]CAF3783134.1 unnamed protein product [Rotaria sp. Silwood1]CAF4791617.1 unnamed protein product [Rotaria sp. Silwood1]
MSNLQSWPDLVGESVDQAVAVIKSQNPHLNVIPVPENSPVTMDFRQDRVRVFFDNYNQVSSAPRVG